MGTDEQNNIDEVEFEVQVQLEEFPEEYEQDLEVDNCWLNEDCVWVND